jgi:hypothetical protein
LFDGTVWLPALVSKIVDVALREDKEEPYMVTEDMVVPVDGNSKFRWLILPLLFLQVKMRGMYFVRIVFDARLLVPMHGRCGCHLQAF